MITQVIAGLGGCVLVVVVAQVYVWLRRADHPAGPPYAAHPATGGRLVVLLCEGWCNSRTRHEDHGDNTATCTGCGTPRTTATDGA